ncbi:MAG: type VI secretion system baseplate subunit TssF [Gluconacetobacter diazotrophicus]|nr:type VI secretion system baseplate subunit TssF [Gluconacetobacter diazotrophicus]
MSDPFLPYYNRELGALRGLAGSFADAHPAAAGRLRLSRDVADDPHVERMLEGVAFLTARVQQRLDDEFPELTDALLNILHPHFLSPVPSASVVRVLPTRNLRDAVQVPAGTELLTDPVNGEPCRFRTTQDVDVLPVEIAELRLSGLPLAAPAAPFSRRAKSVLRLTLRLSDPALAFAALELPRLRLFLRGPGNQGPMLYELLCARAIGIALADGPNDDRPTFLPRDAVEPVGFARDQALLPASARSFSGFRLLTEYFALPEKFLFVDLVGLEARTAVHGSSSLDVFVYFDEAWPELERLVGADSAVLGCTPVVNLFPRACEPIRMDGRTTDYEIVPDARHPDALEVWDIRSVSQSDQDGSSRTWSPFYRRPGQASGAEDAGSYLVARRDSVAPHGGTDVFLLPVDTAPGPDRAADTVLSVDALCTNRDLPSLLPFGNGQPRLRLSSGISSVSAVECLIPFTATGRTPQREGRNRRLISHLSLGHLSIVDGADGALALRDVLDLYDFRRTGATRTAIASLVAIRTSASMARVPGERIGTFVRGLEIELRFDGSAWHSAGLFLLSSVLDRFLALHATVNSFVRTVATLVNRPTDPVARFAARAGERPLL